VSDGTRLGDDLAELERTDPVIADAAARLSRAIDHVLLRSGPDAVPVTRFRKSTPDRPVEVLR